MVRIEGSDPRNYFESIKESRKSHQKIFTMPIRPPSDAPMDYYAYEQDLGQEIQKISNLLHQLREHPELAKEQFFQGAFYQAVNSYKGIISVINAKSSGLSPEERKQLLSMSENFEISVLNKSIPGGCSLSQFDSVVDLSMIEKTLSILVKQSESLNAMDKECATIASNLLKDVSSINKPTQAGIDAARKVANAINTLKQLLLDPNCKDHNGKEKQLAQAVLDLYAAVAQAEQVPGKEGLFLANMWNVIGSQVVFIGEPSGGSLYFAAGNIIEKNDFHSMDRVLQAFQDNPRTFQHIILEDLSQAFDQYTKYGV